MDILNVIAELRSELEFLDASIRAIKRGGIAAEGSQNAADMHQRVERKLGPFGNPTKDSEATNPLCHRNKAEKITR
jgi:hypothetical protein